MKEFFKDYKEMIIDPQNKWMKKHWKGYILMWVAIYGGTLAVLCKDQIKESIEEKIKSKKSQVEES